MGSERPGNPAEFETDEFVRTLFAGLASDDQRLFRHAGYILCQMAHSDEQLRVASIEALVEWAIRRLRNDAVLRTLTTLLVEYEVAVKEILLSVADRRRARMVYERLMSLDPWDVDLEQSEEQLVDVGNKVPILVPKDVLERYRDRHQGDRDATKAHNKHLKTTSPGQKRHWSRWSRLERLEAMDHGDTFATVEQVSRFDEFEFLGPELETRYGHTVQVRTLDGAQEDVAIVKLYHQQADLAFQHELVERFRDWHEIGGDGVVHLADWGETPRPWAIVEYTKQTLWDRGRLTPETVLRTAHDLTAGLARLHQHDLVHGGIDPHSIRYTQSVFDDRPEAKFDNVALISVYRRYDNPVAYLDPRYAAPEYFDGQHGSIGPKTDIYQLGMALYTACTGKQPFDGSFEDIRRQVLGDRPFGLHPDNPDLPGQLGDVLWRATAREKLQRFETATQFHQAVQSVCGEVL